MTSSPRSTRTSTSERCVLRETACTWEQACPFHAVLVSAQDRFLDTLRATSLASLLAPTPAAGLSIADRAALSAPARGRMMFANVSPWHERGCLE